MAPLSRPDRLKSPIAPLVLILLLCALTRLVAFRYDVISDDEAIYYAMGRVVASGGIMYRDCVDHKPPGLTYTYAAALTVARLAGGSDARLGLGLVHGFGILAAMATCFLLFLIARHVLAPRYWVMPPLLYAVVSACKQPVDGLAVNGELLANVPVAAAVLCALSGESRQARRFFFDFIAGTLCAVAGLYKYQAAAVIVAFPLLLADTWKRDRVPGVLLRMTGWTVGFLVPWLLAGGYFAHYGLAREALRWGLLFNVYYISEGPDVLWALQRFALQLAGLVLPSLVLYGGGLLTLWRLCRSTEKSDVVQAGAFLAVWSVMSIAVIGMGQRYFGHYFLQAEPPLALLAAGPAQRLGPRLRSLALGVPLSLFMIAAALPNVSQPYLNAHDPDYHAIGQAVAERTSPTDRFWVWGNVPQIYYAADRLPGVRFTFCNYLTGLSPATRSEHEVDVDTSRNALPWAWKLVLEDLDRYRPTLILDTAAAGIKSYGQFPISRYPTLAAYVARHYRPETTVNGVVFYRRVTNPEES